MLWLRAWRAIRLRDVNKDSYISQNVGMCLAKKDWVLYPLSKTN